MIQIKKFGLIAGAALIAGITVLPIAQSLRFAGAAQASSSGLGQTITISMSGFQPREIQVKHGVPVTLTFINPDDQYHTDGGGWHQWENAKLGINVMIPPQTTKTVTLTFPKPGTYDFVCTVCCGGAANPYMHETVKAV